MKERVDVLLTCQGLAESREKAKALIMAGLVYADGQRVDKAGYTVAEGVSLQIRQKSPFVSRGGLKLKKAIEHFQLRLEGCVCADIGASTGGFTDCMLLCGAEKVYAVDVGYGQLAWSLRNDRRVVNLERTNARYLNSAVIAEKLNFFSIDVSFISLQLILPPVSALLADDAQGVCLIKPQFEAGREWVGKNGVVRKASVHIQVIEKVVQYVEGNGLFVSGLTWSPIKGPKGNIEYLIHVTGHRTCLSEDIAHIVLDAHQALKGE